MSMTNQIEMLCSKYRWSTEQVALGVRARFRCEYCGHNLLRSVDDYDSWQVDHIWPQSASDSPAVEEFDNKAISCRTCNVMKRAWTPLGIEFGDASRDDLIAHAREYIALKRSKKRFELLGIADLAHQLLASDADPLEILRTKGG